MGCWLSFPPSQVCIYIYVYISMISTYLPRSWGCTSIWTLQRFRCDDGMDVGRLRRPTPRSVVKGGNAYRLPSPQEGRVMVQCWMVWGVAPSLWETSFFEQCDLNPVGLIVWAIMQQLLILTRDIIQSRGYWDPKNSRCNTQLVSERIEHDRFHLRGK